MLYHLYWYSFLKYTVLECPTYVGRCICMDAHALHPYVGRPPLVSTHKPHPHMRRCHGTNAQDPCLDLPTFQRVKDHMFCLLTLILLRRYRLHKAWQELQAGRAKIGEVVHMRVNNRRDIVKGSKQHLEQVSNVWVCIDLF